MRKFYGYVSDEHYAVGCTGSTVYVYDKSGNERVGMFLKEDRRTEPSHIEFGADGRIYVLGFLRGEDGVISDGFVSRFDGQGLTDLRVIPDKEYRYYRSFKSLELYGFTEKKKEMFAMVYPDEDLNGTAQKTLPLSELWEKYDSTINA